MNVCPEFHFIIVKEALDNIFLKRSCLRWGDGYIEVQLVLEESSYNSQSNTMPPTSKIVKHDAGGGRG